MGKGAVLSLQIDFQSNYHFEFWQSIFMSQYELTFLLNEEAALKTLKELVTGLEGSVTKEEKWGEKLLAYPIKGLTKAHFYNWVITIPKNRVMELRKKLNYNEKLIRHLLLVVEQ